MARSQPGPSAQLQRLCKTSLSQGHYSWRHNQALKSLVAAIENMRNTINSVPQRATNCITAPTFKRDRESPNIPLPRQKLDS